MSFSRAPWFTSLLLLAGGAIAHQSIAASDAKRVTLHIPPQPVGDALSEFGRQTGLTVMIQSVIGRGLTAPRLEGDYVPVDALDQLLAHTGLRYEYLDDRTVAVLGPQNQNSSTGSAINANKSDRLRSSDPTSETPTEPIRIATSENPSHAAGVGDDSESQKGFKLEEVVVTGTYIRGAPPVGSPLTIYSHADIEQSGAATLSEFAQKMTENFSSIDPSISKQSLTIGQSPFNQASSNAYSGAAFNLHGIGPNATLTLLNGHRVAPAGFDGSFTDISQIPLAAIDHIEVLPDGASAIYGADAVAGVVNIITKKNFSGAQTGLRYGFTTDGGGQQTSASQLLGSAWNGGNIMGTYEYYNESALDASQRDYIPPQGGPQSLIPKARRNSFLVSGRQAIGRSSSLSGDAIFSDRKVYPYSTVDAQIFVSQVQTVNHVAQSGVTLTFDHDFPRDWHWALTGNRSRIQQTANINTQNTGISQSTLQQRTDNDTGITAFESITDGPLVQIAGGAIKAALDIGFRREEYGSFAAISFDGVPVEPTDLHVHRSVSNVAAEMFFPLIGETNIQPWARRLELSAAVRYDHYSDFGTSTNPKYSIRWELLEGLNLRVSYGTSYRAPLLSQLSGGQTYATQTYADAQSPTGFADTLELDGNNPGLLAEKSKSLTAGFDIKTPALPGLSLRATYFRFTYDRRISAPPVTNFDILADPALAPFINKNPSPAEVQTLFNSPFFIGDLVGEGADAVSVIFDDRLTNIAKSRVSGAELAVTYLYSSTYGDFSASLSGDRQFHNDFEAISSGPSTRLLNIVGEPTAWKARGNVGWTKAGFQATLAVNYANRYENVYFVPSEPVASWTTTDLYLGYVTGDADSSALIRNVTLGLAIRNVTNARPPKVLLPDADLAGGLIPQLPYDPANASPTGRIIALSLTKKW